MKKGQWYEFKCPPNVEWRDLGEDPRKILVAVFRNVSRTAGSFLDDDDLLDSYFELIAAGLIRVRMRPRNDGSMEVDYDLWPLTAGAVH